MKEMKEQELTERIRKVFDEFEDPGAEYGWEKLRKKYPENNRKPIWIWWSSAAAILLAAGIWMFSSIPATKEKEEKYHAETNQDHESRIDNTRPVTEPDSQTAELPAIRGDQANAGKAGIQNSRKFTIALAGETPSYTHLNVTADSTAKAKHDPVPAKPMLSSIPDPAVGSGMQTSVPASVNAGAIISNNDSLSVFASANNLAGAKPVQQEGQVSQRRDPENNHLTLSFFAGPHMNYAEGSEAQLNFGVGFTSDIRLLPKLSLTTGLAIARNSLSFTRDMPASANRTANTLLPSNSQGSGFTANFTTITRYQAQLLGLDVPVNLKYQVIPADNKLYLSAGLSSGTYFNESYGVRYQNYNATNGFTSQTMGEQTTKPVFSRFDLARTLNISIGFSSKLNRSRNLTVEPFLKYPLGGLGSENLKFGASGINLRMNFYSDRTNEK